MFSFGLLHLEPPYHYWAEGIVQEFAILLIVVKDHNFSEYGHATLKSLCRVSEKASFSELHYRQSSSWMENCREIGLVSFDRGKFELFADLKIQKVLIQIPRILVFWKSVAPENLHEGFENKGVYVCVSIAPTLIFRMVSISALYHAPIKSYSKNTKVRYILKWIIVLDGEARWTDDFCIKNDLDNQDETIKKFSLWYPAKMTEFIHLLQLLLYYYTIEPYGANC